MSLHAFTDESFRSGTYLVCAVLVDAGSVQRARQHMRRGLKGSQGRVHMAKENAENKRALIRLVSDLTLDAHVIAIQVSGKSQRTARDLCLRELTRTLHDLGASRFILESCDQDRADLQVIGDTLASLNGLEMQVVHHRPHEEPLLWAADVIAWAYGRAGQWRQRLSGVVSREIHL